MSAGQQNPGNPSKETPESRASGSQPFLDSLRQDEDDVTARLIFADWLEEHGYPEEADRQRRWNDAKAWLFDFVSAYRDSLAEYFTEDPVSLDQIVIMGHGLLSTSLLERWRLVNDPLTDIDWLRFFRNWSVITGVPLPEYMLMNDED